MAKRVEVSMSDDVEVSSPHFHLLVCHPSLPSHPTTCACDSLLTCLHGYQNWLVPSPLSHTMPSFGLEKLEQRPPYVSLPSRPRVRPQTQLRLR